MTRLSQRDIRWAYQTIGSTNLLIRDYGCTITSLSMILGTTPDIFNQKMKAVGGYSGALVIWSKIAAAFPGVTAYRYFGYNNEIVKASVPNVTVEVPAYPIGGVGKHWVVYIGNQRLIDPWTGMERPTSDFPNPTGYTIVKGVDNQIPTPLPLTDRGALTKIRTIVESTIPDAGKLFQIKEILTRVGV